MRSNPESPRSKREGDIIELSGRGSAWLERLVRDQEVGGSNPLAPTTFHLPVFLKPGHLLIPAVVADRQIRARLVAGLPRGK